jgi:histidyl-tRNA synthetase
MCADCRRRLLENPLRILDCKEEICQPFIAGAPGSMDSLCPECAGHFDAVRQWLDRLGLRYDIDPRLVRGLDYYTRTVFELVSSDLGAQDTLLGGGRYDDLIEMLGGPSTPGIGFAGGFERLVLALQERGCKPPIERLDLYLVPFGDEGRRAGLALAGTLRKRGVSVDLDVRGRSLRKQLEAANEMNARHVLVLGDEEARTGRGKVKEMDTGVERESSLDVDALIAVLEG